MCIARHSRARLTEGWPRRVCPRGAKQFITAVTFDPEARAVHYATLSSSRERNVPFPGQFIERQRLSFCENLSIELRRIIISSIKNTFSCPWCENLSLSETGSASRPGVEIAKRDAFQLSNSSNNRSTNREEESMVRRVEKMEQRATEVNYQRGKGNDNYSLDKSRWEQRRPLPLARKMASVSGYTFDSSKYNATWKVGGRMILLLLTCIQRAW